MKTTSNKDILIHVALGSNQGDSLSILNAARNALAKLSVRPLKASSWWQTTPVDCPAGSPPFLNGVVALHASPNETPESFLTKLQALERQLGRKPKKIMNEPRLLDLDLLTFGNEVRSGPDLTLPHPRAQVRRFVLAPWAELAPDWVPPGQKQTVRELLSELDDASGVHRLPEI